MLSSSRHPYQATTLPQSHQHARNPWVEKPDSTTNSSCGSRSGRTARNTFPPTTSEWMPRSQTLSHHGPLLNQQIHPVVVPSHRTGSPLSTGHGSSGGVSAAGGIGSCGGQCIACETFCYYCLQVVFIAGILTGIALTIAGSVLHGDEKEADLVVLMYIGVLLVLVCTLLLSVHCCVRRNVKERKRALRLTLMDGPRRGPQPSGDFTSIPVQDFGTDPQFRNSLVETNLNEFDCPDNARPHLNIIPNPTYHFQYRPVVSSNRFGGTRVHTYDRRPNIPDVPERHMYDWGKNPHQPSFHRSYR